MKVSSAKAKGRKLQKDVCKALLEISRGLTEDDIRSTSMGAGGEDVLFSSAAKRQFPLSIECKNVERFSIWPAIDQGIKNCPSDLTPVVVFKKNHRDPQISLPLEKFLEIYKVYLQFKDTEACFDQKNS